MACCGVNCANITSAGAGFTEVWVDELYVSGGANPAPFGVGDVIYFYEPNMWWCDCSTGMDTGLGFAGADTIASIDINNTMFQMTNQHAWGPYAEWCACLGSTSATSCDPSSSSSSAAPVVLACDYSVEVSVDWSGDEDMDIYLRTYGGCDFDATTGIGNDDVVYFGNTTAEADRVAEGSWQIELNHDAHANCDASPNSPEAIATVPGYHFDDNRKFEAWFNQFSNCLPELGTSNVTKLFKITNHHPTNAIEVNGTVVSANGGTFEVSDFAYAGYGNGSIEGFAGQGTVFEVTACQTCPSLPVPVPCDPLISITHPARTTEEYQLDCNVGSGVITIGATDIPISATDTALTVNGQEMIAFGDTVRLEVESVEYWILYQGRGSHLFVIGGKQAACCASNTTTLIRGEGATLALASAHANTQWQLSWLPQGYIRTGQWIGVPATTPPSGSAQPGTGDWYLNYLGFDMKDPVPFAPGRCKSVNPWFGYNVNWAWSTCYAPPTLPTDPNNRPWEYPNPDRREVCGGYMRMNLHPYIGMYVYSREPYAGESWANFCCKDTSMPWEHPYNSALARCGTCHTVHNINPPLVPPYLQPGPGAPDNQPYTGLLPCGAHVVEKWHPACSDCGIYKDNFQDTQPECQASKTFCNTGPPQPPVRQVFMEVCQYDSHHPLCSSSFSPVPPPTFTNPSVSDSCSLASNLPTLAPSTLNGDNCNPLRGILTIGDADGMRSVAWVGLQSGATLTGNWIAGARTATLNYEYLNPRSGVDVISIVVTDVCGNQAAMPLTISVADVTPCNTTTPNPTIGACCIGTTCMTGTQAACQAVNGVYQGRGTTCTPNPCAIAGSGACCLGFYACTIATQAICTTIGGSYRGDGTDCNPNPCSSVSPTPPPGGGSSIGACCEIISGVAGPAYNCHQVTAVACAAMVGVTTTTIFRGVGTSCIPWPACSASPTPPGGGSSIGACCSAYNCTTGTQTDCNAIGGLYQGHGTNCTPDPCSSVSPTPPPGGGSSIGACCSANNCTTGTQANCTTIGGVYQGHGTNCTPDPCSSDSPTPPPSGSEGACCINGVCLMGTQTDCGAIGGVYQGHGTDCIPDPCSSSPSPKPRQPLPSASCVPCDYIYKALIPRVQRIKIRVPRLFTEDEVKGKWIVLPPKKYNDFVWNYVGSSSHSSSFTQILGECGKWQYYKIIRPVNYEGECSIAMSPPPSSSRTSASVTPNLINIIWPPGPSGSSYIIYNPVWWPPLPHFSHSSSFSSLSSGSSRKTYVDYAHFKCTECSTDRTVYVYGWVGSWPRCDGTVDSPCPAPGRQWTGFFSAWSGFWSATTMVVPGVPFLTCDHCPGAGQHLREISWHDPGIFGCRVQHYHHGIHDCNQAHLAMVAREIPGGYDAYTRRGTTAGITLTHCLKDCVFLGSHPDAGPNHFSPMFYQGAGPATTTYWAGWMIDTQCCMHDQNHPYWNPNGYHGAVGGLGQHVAANPYKPCCTGSSGSLASHDACFDAAGACGYELAKYVGNMRQPRGVWGCQNTTFKHCLQLRANPYIWGTYFQGEGTACGAQITLADRRPSGCAEHMLYTLQACGVGQPPIVYLRDDFAGGGVSWPNLLQTAQLNNQTVTLAIGPDIYCYSIINSVLDMITPDTSQVMAVDRHDGDCANCLSSGHGDLTAEEVYNA